MKMVDRYIEDLSDENPIKRISAAKQLGIYFDTKALPYLIESLKDSDERVVEQAIYSLGVFGQEETVEPLMNCLNYDSEIVKLAAIKVLGEMQTSAVVPSLGKMLKDGNPKIRLAAAKALGQIGDKRGMFFLIDAINDPVIDVAHTITLSLSQIKDKETIPALISVLEHHSMEVRYVAALALGKFKDERIIKPLVNMMSDTNPKLRTAALLGLKQMGDNQVAVNTFIKALDDEDVYVKQTAAFNLAELKNPKTAEFFIDKLRTGDNIRIRVTAARALGSMRIINAVPVFIDLLKDEDDQLVAECISALTEIKDPASTKFLVRLLNHENEKIQVLALKAIAKIEMSSLISINFKEKYKKITAFMYLVPIKAKTVRKYSLPIRIAAFAALGKLAFGRGDLAESYKNYKMAADTAPVWENMKYFYQAHSYAADNFDLMSRGKHTEILKTKRINEMIELYTKSGRMINIKLLSTLFWPIIESYCELYMVEEKAKGKEKEEFNLVFNELMQRLSHFEQKFPKDKKADLSALYTIVEDLIKLTTKSGKLINDIPEELGKVENELFKIQKLLVLYEPDDLKFGIASDEENYNKLFDKETMDGSYLEIQSNLLAFENILEENGEDLLRPRMEKKYEIEIEEIPPLESDRIMDDSMTVGVAQFLKGEYSVQHLIEDSYEYLINKESLKESVVTERPLDILRKGMKKYYNNELIDKFSVYQFKKDALNGVKGKVVSILDEARLEDCSIVVFPENSMMSEYVPKLQHYADFYNSIIIYGEEHLPGDQSVYINRIGVIFPHRGAIRQVIKNKPSEYERDVELIKAQEIPVFKVFRTPLGNFMAFHGNDYRAYNEYIDHFIKEQDLNFLVIISNYYWNKDELNNLLKKSVEQHIPIIFANTALFGGSNIYPLNKKGLKPKCENILIQKWPKDRLYDIVEQDLVVDEKEEKKQQEIQAQVDRFKKIF